MRRLFRLETVPVMPIGSLLSSLSVFGVSIADNTSPNNEITTSQTEASNYSASATITITMYTVDDEQSK